MEQFNQEILLLSNAFCEFRYSYEHALSLDLQFFRTWCSAIFEQVEKYPSYKLVEDYSGRSISEDDFDKKFHYTHNQMLSRLNRKSKQLNQKCWKEQMNFDLRAQGNGGQILCCFILRGHGLLRLKRMLQNHAPHSCYATDLWFRR